MPRLILVFAGRTCDLLVLSLGGSISEFSVSVFFSVGVKIPLHDYRTVLDKVIGDFVQDIKRHPVRQMLVQLQDEQKIHGSSFLGNNAAVQAGIEKESYYQDGNQVTYDY